MVSNGNYPIKESQKFGFGLHLTTQNISVILIVPEIITETIAGTMSFIVKGF